MDFEVYVGIDVSKLTLDVFIREKGVHHRFKNDPTGFSYILQWVQKNTETPLGNTLFCFEHTGLYSLPLAFFLEENSMPFSMIPALEIKRSMGITRGKNDLVDSKRIAEFAYRFRDKIQLTKLPAGDIMKLQSLSTLRDRLVRIMSGYTVTMNEQLKFMNHGDNPVLYSSYQNVICTMKEEIKKLENAIHSIIKENEELKNTFQLITSIKGVGFLVGVYLIVYTYNFTRFANWRKFACYSGVAPFDYQSGTSVKGKTQVSSIANKQVKKMLHLAAMSAAHTDTELREYYLRRQAEGKPKMAILNIIRNKVLSRVFAIVKRQTPFVDIKKYAV